MKCGTVDHIALQEKHHPEGNESPRTGEGESHVSHGILYSLQSCMA